MSENKEFYVTIQGKKVFVSEEVYREYVRPIRAIQRQQRRAWKCRIVGRKGNLIRCPYKCEECPYAIAGKLPTGNVLSLDKFKEMGIEILDAPQWMGISEYKISSVLPEELSQQLPSVEDIQKRIK